MIPLDPGHARVMLEGAAAVWRTRDAGGSWERLAQGLLRSGRARRRPARGDGARHRRPARRLLRHEGTGQLFASADEGELIEIASYPPPIASVEVAVVD